MDLHQKLAGQRKEAEAEKRKYIKELSTSFGSKSGAKEQVKRYRGKLKEKKENAEEGSEDSGWESVGESSFTSPQRTLLRGYVENDNELDKIEERMKKYEAKMD